MQAEPHYQAAIAASPVPAACPPRRLPGPGSPQRKCAGGHQVRPRLARVLGRQQQVQSSLLLLAALHQVAAKQRGEGAG